EEAVKLVPLDLEAGEGGDEVVHVGGGGDVDGEGLFAVVEPAAAAAWGGDGLPLLDVEALPGEDLGGLAHEDAADVHDAVGEALDAVEKGGHVGGFVAGVDVEGGVGVEVGLLEGFDLDLAGGAEHGGEGADVKLNVLRGGGVNVLPVYFPIALAERVEPPLVFFYLHC